MKKTIALLAVGAAFSVTADDHKMMKMEAPTVYGKLNKVFTYIDQEDVHNRKSTDGITDVSNSESRIGAKGKGEVLGMETHYKLELGVNSTNKNDGGDEWRIRVRESLLKMKGKYGTAMLGQTYGVVVKQGRRSDPLQETIAGHQGDDMKNRVANAVKDLGFNDRSRADLIGYVSPSFHGLTYSLSQDRGEGFSNAVGDTNYGVTTNEHLVRYQRDMGNVDVDLYVGLQATARAAAQVDEETMTYGFNLGFNNFGLNFAMSTEEYDGNSNNNKDERERMFGALTYEMNKNKYSFTYQTREDSTDGSATAEYTQMAVNWAHKCNKWATVNLTAMKYEKELQNTALTGDALKLQEADATILAAGIQLKF